MYSWMWYGAFAEAMIAVFLGLLSGAVGGLLLGKAGVPVFAGTLIVGLPVGIVSYLLVHWLIHRRVRSIVETRLDKVALELKNLGRADSRAYSCSGLGGRSFARNHRNYVVTTPGPRSLARSSSHDFQYSIDIRGPEEEEDYAAGVHVSIPGTPESKCSQLNAPSEDATPGTPHSLMEYHRPTSSQSTSSNFSMVDYRPSPMASERKGHIEE